MKDKSADPMYDVKVSPRVTYRLAYVASTDRNGKKSWVTSAHDPDHKTLESCASHARMMQKHFEEVAVLRVEETLYDPETLQPIARP